MTEYGKSDKRRFHKANGAAKAKQHHPGIVGLVRLLARNAAERDLKELRKKAKKPYTDDIQEN